MKYLSTRGGESEVSFTSVLLNGLAKDGGLYIPKSLPKFSSKHVKTSLAISSVAVVQTSIMYKK